MDTLRSAINRQTNVKPRQLEFYFDEFVEVKDPIKEVLVSPPLTYIPQVKYRGKKVIFAFDEKEILRENATYTINFGEAIVDFHEGNKLSNFNYVFGTGSELDSMSLRGKIINIQTKEAESEMVVFLYDNLNDSIVRKEKPFYFARPDKTGNFEFKNVKSDTFRLLAIKDENLNYRYDLSTEKIAFHSDLIILNDTFKQSITLNASLPTPTLQRLSADTKTYGKINILYNTTPSSPVVYSLSDTTMLHTSEISDDSLNIYYETLSDSFFVYLYHNDTIKVKPKGKQDYLKKNKFVMVSSNTSAQTLTTDSITVKFNKPILEFNPSKIMVSDSIGILDGISMRLSKDKKSIELKYDWNKGEQYAISIDSGAITSFYGEKNDSLGLEFSVLKTENTANLLITIEDMDSTALYVLRVLRDKREVYTTMASGTSTKTISLKGLVPDKYNIEIIQDENKNGIWDAGNYWQRKQPEPFRFVKGETIRENRETEIRISMLETITDPNELKQQQGGLKLNIKK